MKSKHHLLVLTILLGTPLLCVLLGALSNGGPQIYYSADGYEFNRLLPWYGLLIGGIGSIAGTVIGLPVSALTKQTGRTSYAVLAFAAPCALAFAHMLSIYINHLLNIWRL